jgi:hypothetical protein
MNKHINVKAKKTSEDVDVSRRGFMVGAAAGAGFVMGYALLPNLDATIGEAQAAGNFSPNIWVTIDGVCAAVTN